MVAIRFGRILQTRLRDIKVDRCSYRGVVAKCRRNALFVGYLDITGVQKGVERNSQDDNKEGKAGKRKAAIRLLKELMSRASLSRAKP